MRSSAVLGVLIACYCTGHDALARRPVEPATCLPNVVTARVLSLELPGGAHRYVDEFWIGQSLPVAGRAFAVSLRDVASPGHLMRRRAGQWQTYSFWVKERFCVIQVRAAGPGQTYGLSTLTDYGLMRRLASRKSGKTETEAGFRPPPWWPHLQACKVERWLDAGRRVTTITGFSASSLPGTREQIVRAVARGGFVPSAQMLVPSSATGQAPSNRAGLMLLFQGPNRELAVTLTAMARLTGVVAHLEER